MYDYACRWDVNKCWLLLYGLSVKNFFSGFLQVSVTATRYLYGYKEVHWGTFAGANDIFFLKNELKFLLGVSNMRKWNQTVQY